VNPLRLDFNKSDDGDSISTKLTVTFPDMEKSKAVALMEAAHQVCRIPRPPAATYRSS